MIKSMKYLNHFIESNNLLAHKNVYLCKPSVLIICLYLIYNLDENKQIRHVTSSDLIYQLIDYLIVVLRPAQEYFTYMETSPLPVKGYKI
jgi:hypothetical protein